MSVGDTHHWTSQWILLRACVVAGDETILAKQLGVPVSSVVNWVLGDARVPTDYLPRAVDIVVGERAKKLQAHKDQVLANREFLERIRRQYRIENPGPT
jgi:hypothetical protein